jgi:2'-5' RNA ligase
MRLFFALWPDEGVRARLAEWSRELRVPCGGRPVPAQKLHMTLAFLGSVEEGRIAEVERAAGEVAPRAMSLVLDQPGYWKHNRIVWAGASAAPPELEGLVLELRSALTRSRIAFDPKGFASHVTLLRDAREPRAMPELKAIRWELDGFALVRSPIERGGGPYEVLDSWGLRRGS